MTEPIRLAHRGDWRQAPENSLEAIRAALADPRCDGLEFDVRNSADDAPVLLHDPTLRRVQGRDEAVDELTAAELARLGVPLLRDVLAEVPQDIFLDVEVKTDPGPNFFDVVEAARGRDGYLQNAVVSSFSPKPLDRLGEARPQWERWLNAWDMTDATLDRARRLGCRVVSAHWRVIDEHSMARAHAAGLGVAAFTVRRRSTFDRLARLGVVAVCVEAAALDG